MVQHLKSKDTQDASLEAKDLLVQVFSCTAHCAILECVSILGAWAQFQLIHIPPPPVITAARARGQRL